MSQRLIMQLVSGLLRGRFGNKGIIIAIVLALGFFAWQYFQSGQLTGLGNDQHTQPEVSAPAPETTARKLDPLQGDEIDALFRAKRSEVMVTVNAKVVKLLPDDNDGSRHQRFIIDAQAERTLLVAHNIDLAPRVPLRKGDRITLRGQYEWNARGGVLHWTHHDPAKRHDEGWIKHKDNIYQ